MRQAYSVSEVNRFIKNMFSREPSLDRISILGEVSNCKYHSSGHIYFTLKDASSTIACVMFAGNRRGLDFVMKDGMSVVATGSVNVYERDGKYQLYAASIFREGFGKLYERLEILKKKLLDEGLFSDVYKKKLPYYSGKVGIVTAQTGAAIQDIVNIAGRRNPYVQLYLYPAIVQGEEAPASIAAGISYLDKMGLDVIIVGRGGGSFEDLFAFNEEIVVRAIFACNTPVISAVGHETDTTLSDYVADMRAPTPSAAAEIAVMEYSKIVDQIEDYKKIFARLVSARIETNRNRLKILDTKLRTLSPAEYIRSRRQYTIEIEDKINRIIRHKLDRSKQQLVLYTQKLKVLSPLHRLSGGYSYVTDKEGTALTSVKQVSDGDNIEITVTDGKIKAAVINVEGME